MHGPIWDKDISMASLFAPYFHCHQNFLEKKKASSNAWIKFNIWHFIYILYKNKGIDIFKQKQFKVSLGLSYCSNLVLSIRKAPYVGMFMIDIIVTHETKT